MEHRLQSQQEADSPFSIYSRYITSCYNGQLAARPYYQQLQDYLMTDGSTLLQKLKCFEMRREALKTGSLTDSDLSSPRRRPCIVVLDGFPSPQCISTIGAKEMVRPELFIGHLGFTCNRPSYRKFFELPSVPSDRRNVIHVRLISMAQTMTGDTKVKSLAQNRTQADTKCTDIEHQLFSKKQYGAPRFRKVHLHNSRTFSVEQLVSFSITQRGNEPWCGKSIFEPSQVTSLSIAGVFLLDRGYSLQGQHNLPWSNHIGGRSPAHFIPVIPYNRSESPNNNKGAATSPSHPYHPIDDLWAEDEGEIELIRQDPFFILSRLFSSAGRSFSPVLNHLDEDIEACASCPTTDETQLSAALEQLQFNARLIVRFEGFLEENYHVIEEGGDESWPKASDLALQERLVKVQVSLKKDYKSLLARCARLASRCEVSSRTLVGAMQLLEAKKGIDQTKQVHKLTRLAFIFIPLTFVSGVFGMNVSTFKDYPPLWTYFVVAIPLTFVSWYGSGISGSNRHKLPRFLTMESLKKN